MKRFTAGLLLICMLVCAFAACGNKNPETTTPAVSDVTDAVTTEAVATTPAVTTYYPDIPDEKNYDDYTFTVFVSTTTGVNFNDFSSENADYDVVNEAIFQRNSLVSEKLGVVIDNRMEIGSAFQGGPGMVAIKADYVAAESLYDLVALGTWQGPDAALNGYVLDLNEVPYIDLTKPWWDQRANSDLGIGGKMFFTTGDIGVTDNFATHCLFFSKTIAEEKNITDIYDLVLNYKWTWDKLEEYIRMVSDDLNGDDVMNIYDRFGVLWWDDSIQAGLGGIRSQIAGVNDEDKLEVTMWTEKNVDLANRLTTLFFDTRYGLNYGVQSSLGMTENQGITTMFANGQGLFLTTLFLKAPLLRDCEMDFGIIPYPMYNEEQGEYGGYVGATFSNMYAIEYYAEDTERCGIVTELLAAVSKNIVTPAYYEHTLKGREARDEESIECLELIFANRSFDAGVFYGIGGYTGDLTSMMNNFVNRYQSIYEGSKRAATVKVNTINKKLTGSK